MRHPEIDFDPTSSDARRDRTERAVLSRLAAIQALGESDAVIAPSTPRIRWVAFGIAAAAVAAVLTFVLVRPAPIAERLAEAPSLIVTPVGGSSRFTVGNAVIEAAGDTSVEVKRESSGATTLLLARGSVDCDVEPKPGRQPFRVVAGEVTVEVVGTRFAVRRSDISVRVDVTRGKVRVRTQADDRMLEAGGSWSSPLTASISTPTVVTSPVTSATAASSTPSTPATATPSVTTGDDASSTKPPTTTEPVEAIDGAKRPSRPSSRAAFAAAQRLESTDPNQAARAYRTIANGSDVWAALALYSLAEVHAGSDPASALRDLDELAKRFPRGANAEDAAWLRVTVLRKLNRDADARRAASEYLRQFPRGTYAKSAERLASP